MQLKEKEIIFHLKYWDQLFFELSFNLDVIYSYGSLLEGWNFIVYL